MMRQWSLPQAASKGFQDTALHKILIISPQLPTYLHPTSQHHLLHMMIRHWVIVLVLQVTIRVASQPDPRSSHHTLSQQKSQSQLWTVYYAILNLLKKIKQYSNWAAPLVALGLHTMTLEDRKCGSMDNFVELIRHLFLYINDFQIWSLKPWTNFQFSTPNSV